jgi:hypothetical protein
MTDVACFCNCVYSFEGAAGACPRCGEVASIATGAASADDERSRRARERMPLTGGSADGPVSAGELPEIDAWLPILSGI